MRRIGWLIATFCFAFVVTARAQHQHGASGDFGTVRFPTSCAPAVQPDFERAVSMLHSFQYEQAKDAFEQVARKDTNCAMAWWGVAMTEYHGLWAQIWEKEGKAAVEKARSLAEGNSPPSAKSRRKGRTAATPQPSKTDLTATPATAKTSVAGDAGGGSPTTQRERAYIEAIATIFDDPSKPLHERSLAYEHAMDKLRTSYPDDTEATIFYALALDVNAPKGDKTYANQRKARDLLVPLFEKQPQHPGLAHYIIHVSDFPPLAAGALGAARRYALIAPASAHAQHMPSHIFTRLGLWDESIASNLASAASAEHADKTGTTNEGYNQRLHALDYLEYAYLQQGNWDKAREVMELARAIRRAKDRDNVGTYAEAAIPARYALERHDWKMAASLAADTGNPVDDAMTAYANGLGAAMLGDFAAAVKAATQLAAYRDQVKPTDTYWAQQVEILRLQVVAWHEFKAGKNEEGLRDARSAADMEDASEKDPVTPGPVLPARENLAEMLLQAGRRQEARKEFDAVLKVAPGRYNAAAGVRKAAATDTQLPVGPYRQGYATRERIVGPLPDITNSRRRRRFTPRSSPAARAGGGNLCYNGSVSAATHVD